MAKKITIVSLAATLILDIIACVMDSNLSLYQILTVLMCVTFIVFVGSMFAIKSDK